VYEVNVRSICLKSLKCIYFKFICSICFACCMLKQKRDLFYFWVCSRIYTLLWKDFSCFRRLILSLSWKSNDRGARKRYFSQITLTNRIYLFNPAEYLAASKPVACKQVQNFRPPRSFDFQLRLKINLGKQEQSFQRSV
jgi:hypothetical protein